MSDGYDYDNAERAAAYADENTARRFTIRSGQPRNKGKPRPRGPGPCPKCGGETKFRPGTANYDPFYGCANFPACRGARVGTFDEVKTHKADQAFYAERGVTDQPCDGDAAIDTHRPKIKYPYGIKHHPDGQKQTGEIAF